MWTVENRGRYDRSMLRYPTIMVEALPNLPMGALSTHEADISVQLRSFEQPISLSAKLAIWVFVFTVVLPTSPDAGSQT
ncbi:hypothetical protein [Acidisphaera sp. L21]|uniref:hypothetical protein n=1 Tax=Acidisphaera sp. L21 TaxID=1641851 RepID=UPI00131B9D19|nr:hypothetical protein [Acidisphaera sp. L21]